MTTSTNPQPTKYVVIANNGFTHIKNPGTGKTMCGKNWRGTDYIPCTEEELTPQHIICHKCRNIRRTDPSGVEEALTSPEPMPQYRFTILKDVSMVADADGKFTLPAGTIYTGSKYEQVGNVIFLDTNECGGISVDLDDVKIELAEPATRKKLVHCHFCPEHLLFPKSNMKKFMLDKCTQQFVCPGHLHLVNPRKIVKPLEHSATVQSNLF